MINAISRRLSCFAMPSTSQWRHRDVDVDEEQCATNQRERPTTSTPLSLVAGFEVGARPVAGPARTGSKLINSVCWTARRHQVNRWQTLTRPYATRQPRPTTSLESPSRQPPPPAALVQSVPIYATRVGWSSEIEYLFTRVIVVYGSALLLNERPSSLRVRRASHSTYIKRTRRLTVTSTLLSLSWLSHRRRPTCHSIISEASPSSTRSS